MHSPSLEHRGLLFASETDIIYVGVNICRGIGDTPNMKTDQPPPVHFCLFFRDDEWTKVETARE